MLRVIQQRNKNRYKGTVQETKSMSAATITKKVPKSTAPKMTRKERRAKREVDALQEQATPILPATTFKRIVTQEARNVSTDALRFNADAVKALQAAAEEELTNIFTGAAFCAGMAKRDTVTVEDMRNFQALRRI